MGEASMPRRGGGGKYKFGGFQGNGFNEMWHDDFINAKEVYIFAVTSFYNISENTIISGEFVSPDFDDFSGDWPAVMYIEPDGTITCFSDVGHIVAGGTIYTGMAVLSSSQFYYYIAIY